MLNIIGFILFILNKYNMSLFGSTFANGSNYRLRRIDPFYTFRWQETSDFSKAGDEIIEAPEKHLLSQADLYNAEGGHSGMFLQLAVTLLGVGSLFAMGPRTYAYYRGGMMRFKEWACLGAVGLVS